MKESRMKRKYGINQEEYEELYRKQEGLCAICKQPPSIFYGQPGHLVIDHDHHTKRVRGLLCSKCNSLVGQIETNRSRIHESRRYSLTRYQEAILYLQK